tara:strand:- start:525 stop:1013 length:489 start_codon:yes stop_codon:yes gene_type:complete
MNTIQPISGTYYRRFQPNSYKENDGMAKNIVTKYLKGNGHINFDDKENYSFDIKSEKNGHTYYSEVEMKNQWRGDWNTSWKEIRIPYRKFKLINKFAELNNKDAYLNFYIIRSDCEYAWRIKDHQLTDDSIKEIWLGNARRKEHFFHIPYLEAELVHLKGTK